MEKTFTPNVRAAVIASGHCFFTFTFASRITGLQQAQLLRGRTAVRIPSPLRAENSFIQLPSSLRSLRFS
jgi:hypothetical protein